MINKIAKINEIMNHPDVFPYVNWGMPYPMDFSVLLNTDCKMFCCDGIAVILCGKGDHEYEAHLAALPESRGKKTISYCKSIIDNMFTSAECKRIFCDVPITNKAARKMCRLIGMWSNGLMFARYDTQVCLMERFSVEKVG